MSFFTTNHDEAKNKFDPVKPGKYEVVVTAVEVTNAKTSGNEMIKVTYTVRSDVDQLFQKRKVFDNYVASEKAMFKFQQAAKAMGLPSGANIPTIQWFADQLLYKAFKLTIRNVKDTYQGEERLKEEVGFIDAPGIPYSGGSGGTATDPFALPGGATDFPSDFPDGNADDDDVPPWERAESDPAPADVDQTEATTGDGKPPKTGRGKKNKTADDDKPIDISDDDLPY